MFSDTRNILLGGGKIRSLTPFPNRNLQWLDRRGLVACTDMPDHRWFSIFESDLAYSCSGTVRTARSRPYSSTRARCQLALLRNSQVGTARKRQKRWSSCCDRRKICDRLRMDHGFARARRTAHTRSAPGFARIASVRTRRSNLMVGEA